MTRGAPRFAGSEADLCDWLIEREARHGWTAYPETGDWDVLMVREADGLQVGIQAKLRANFIVVEQALSLMRRATYGGDALPPGYRRGQYPDLGAVLVAHLVAGFDPVVKAAGLRPVAWREERQDWQRDISLLPRVHGGPAIARSLRPVELPPFVPKIRAGEPCPTPLTRWKLSGLRLCLLLRERGFVTTEDIRGLGMSPTWWLGRLAQSGTVPGRRLARLVRGDEPLLDDQFPELAAQVAAHYGAPAAAAAAIGGAA